LRGEPTIKRRDQAVQISVFGFQFANIRPYPRHRPKADNQLAFHEGPQPDPAPGEVATDLLALVGKNTAEVRRLRGVRRTSRASNPLRTSHRRNLAAPLGGCQSGHMFSSIGGG
jgi:hypothetical protein